MTKTRLSLVTMTIAAVAAVGCADGASRLSPIGPSPVAEVPATTAPNSLAGWAAANGWTAMADGRTAVEDGLLVEGTDVIGSVTGNCPSRSLTVRGVPVSVTSATLIASPLSCASLASGTPIKVTGLLSHTASGLSVSAMSLSSPQGSTKAPSPNRGGERLSGEGVVGAVRGACPELTFVVNGYSVKTDTGTEFKTACDAIREGTKVKLEVEQTDDGIVAVWVEAVRTPGAQ